jgi:hypothetical protein
MEPRANYARSRRERFVAWLRSVFRREDGKWLNETHDRSEDRRQRDIGGEMLKDRPPNTVSSTQGNHMDRLFPEVQELRRKNEFLEARVGRLEERTQQLESQIDDLYGPQLNRDFGSSRVRKPSYDGNSSAPPRSSASPLPTWAESSARSGSVRLESLEQAVTETLQDLELGHLGSTELLRTVQSRLGGAQIEMQLLGRQRHDGWQMLVLLIPQSQEGVLLVSPGELVYSDVAQYFEGEFGRRIRSCRMPAAVKREGSSLSVVRKGRIEIS